MVFAHFSKSNSPTSPLLEKRQGFYRFFFTVLKGYTPVYKCGVRCAVAKRNAYRYVLAIYTQNACIRIRKRKLHPACADSCITTRQVLAVIAVLFARSFNTQGLHQVVKGLIGQRLAANRRYVCCARLQRATNAVLSCPSIRFVIRSREGYGVFGMEQEQCVFREYGFHLNMFLLRFRQACRIEGGYAVLLPSLQGFKLRLIAIYVEVVGMRRFFKRDGYRRILTYARNIMVRSILLREQQRAFRQTVYAVEECLNSPVHRRCR